MITGEVLSQVIQALPQAHPDLSHLTREQRHQVLQTVAQLNPPRKAS